MEDHDVVIDEIPAYVAGRLDGMTRDQVERHLARCPECAEMVASWKSIAASLRDRGADFLAPHPDETTLCSYAQGATGADSKITAHVATCLSCELEVAAWRAGAAGLAAGAERAGPAASTGSPRRFEKFWPAGALGLAAGLVIGAVLGPFLLTSGRAPVADRGMGGPLQLLLLNGPLRGETPIPEFRFDPTRAVGLFAMQVPIPDATPDDAAYTFHLTKETGEEVWSVRATAGQMRAAMESTAVVTLPVPTTALAPGGYTMRLGREDVPESRPILEISFRLNP